ncbi:hypothetical protein LOZ61_005882 [Ophidiomyces ophidiicola]|nr:hypothetical protein LOZ61_005882 [Ophidiomyces ophidiicola]KAI1908975.1 hypothetical protein LOZ64_005389 [Ophidiomyces ophidiicola]KAI1923267.1 hypothetical protein LOZ60_005270 [Ophidiomyces ophidiicola]KAI1953049.1 hypothetical protein LOZ59_005285 [Ophidiomyces ophidiicola]KAI2120446.1 hypothetical protein LOZ31_005526 [Ophidiomyces ophidiicola]
MAPPVTPFPAASLPVHVHLTTHGFKPKARKGPPTDLSSCPLYAMTQFSCNPPSKGVPDPGIVRCETVVRLFRRCANGVNAETTTLEGPRYRDATTMTFEATDRA